MAIGTVLLTEEWRLFLLESG